MINIEDKTYQPSFEDLKGLIDNRAFDSLDESLTEKYGGLKTIQYSGDNVLLGWNLRYKKRGKSLCTVYPRAGFFLVLVVIGPKEKQGVIDKFASFSESFQRIYNESKEGMGQRWLVLTIKEVCPLLEDIKSIIALRMAN